MPGPSEEEKRKSWGTDMKAEGQQPGCLLNRPFRGMPRRAWLVVSPQSPWEGRGGSPVHFGAGELRPLHQADLFPFSVSWKVGPWTPCSVSCGGGFQSRPVYCISSDGAGGQEAAEEIQCAGLPGKPPATQACNLQRCAAWSVEPWGEVRPCPGLGAVSWAWVAAGLG